VDYRTGAVEWTWEQVAHLHTWGIGHRIFDAISEGFWLERTAAVPAWGIEVATRARSLYTRHSIRVEGTRVALLHCHDKCRHGERLLNALTQASPTQADEDRTPLRWQDVPMVVAPPAGGRRVAAMVGRDVKLTVLPESWSSLPIAYLWLYGSTWDRERVRRASAALIEHIA